MRISYIFLCSLLTLALASGVLAQDYSGTWLGTVSESVSWCENLGKAEPGDYKLTIIHKGNDITIMENVVQRPYKGVINPKKPRKVHVGGSYVDDGGYISELIDIVFEKDSAGLGESVWRWSDGYYECGGRFKFALKRIRR